MQPSVMSAAISWSRDREEFDGGMKALIYKSADEDQPLELTMQALWLHFIELGSTNSYLEIVADGPEMVTLWKMLDSDAKAKFLSAFDLSSKTNEQADEDLANKAIEDSVGAQKSIDDICLVYHLRDLTFRGVVGCELRFFY
jgi:hypothetical protein